MSPILGVWASAQQSAFVVGDYESIATTTVGAGGVSSVTFSSIPSTYAHLQIRGIVRAATANDALRLQFNSDAGSNYSRHYLYGNGSSAFAAGASSVTSIGTGVFANSSSTSSVFTGLTIDILDYANTSKNSTVRTMSGYDTNGSGFVGLYSGAWFNTAAITSINFFMDSGNIDQYSQFALYGIKG